MNLADQNQVAALLRWAEDTEGRKTADACRSLVEERIAQGQFDVKNRVEFVAIARSRAHAARIAGARELANAKLDSELRFGKVVER